MPLIWNHINMDVFSWENREFAIAMFDYWMATWLTGKSPGPFGVTDVPKIPSQVSSCRRLAVQLISW